MFGSRLLPPATEHERLDIQRTVRVAFSGRFQIERSDAAGHVPMGCSGLQWHTSVGYDGHSIEIEISVPARSTDPAECVREAIGVLAQMPCFYPGMLDDADNVRIEFAAERARDNPWRLT